MDRITLSGMRLECRIGASEEERALPQLLEIDLEVEADLAAAAASDRLDEGVDYGPLVRLVERASASRSFHLLEGLAGEIVRAALSASPRIGAVTVRVRKLAVPIEVDMDHAQVELRRSRD